MKTAKDLIRAHRDDHAQTLAIEHHDKLIVTNLRTGSPDVDDVIDIVLMDPGGATCEAILYFTLEESATQEELSGRVTRYCKGLLDANIRTTNVLVHPLGLTGALKEEYGLSDDPCSDTLPAWLKDAQN